MSLWKVDGQVPRITCAILTRAAAPSVSGVHDRMPVVLPEAAFSRWLDPAMALPADISKVLEAAEGEFAHHKVSPRLNAAKNDDETLLQAI
jgi:putative SOS response-associated peptidase YedK